MAKIFTISFEEKSFIKPDVLVDSKFLRVYKSELKSYQHIDILYSWLRNKARKVIPERTYQLANLHGYEFKEIRIKDQSSRWGSCSSKKNLNFNWKLILVEKEEMDYVIIHELAHLKQMNHSKNFWDLVEVMMPDYRKHRKSLKEKEKELVR